MLKKIKLISNSICYGPPPELEDEVEQRLSLTAEGRLVFTRYNYGGKRIAYKRLRITQNDAQDILKQIELGIASECLRVFDVGVWELTVENEAGETSKITGSLSAGHEILTPVSAKLRKLTQLPLYVFDGEVDDDFYLELIDVNRACEIATVESGEPFVKNITDIGYGFVITTMTKDGEVAELPSMLIDKVTGKVEPFLFQFRVEEYKKGTRVRVPSKFRKKS